MSCRFCEYRYGGICFRFPEPKEVEMDHVCGEIKITGGIGNIKHLLESRNEYYRDLQNEITLRISLQKKIKELNKKIKLLKEDKNEKTVHLP